LVGEAAFSKIGFAQFLSYLLSAVIVGLLQGAQDEKD
jgi:hypothetical protein